MEKRTKLKPDFKATKKNETPLSYSNESESCNTNLLEKILSRIQRLYTQLKNSFKMSESEREKKELELQIVLDLLYEN